MTTSRLDDLMREGEEALEAGELATALDRFESVLREDPEHWGAALDRVEALHLLWRTRDALRLIQSLRPPDDEEDDADRLDLEARIREAAGDFEEADRLFTEASRLDPEQFPLPCRVTTEDFRTILDEAVGSLPATIRDAVDLVPVVVEPMPRRAMGEQAPDITPELLGLFVGTEIGQKQSGGVEYGDVVFLFQRNLERAGVDRSEVAEQIRITLLHEYGHYLGFDEEGLDGMGLA